jgi:hypothetical protein
VGPDESLTNIIALQLETGLPVYVENKMGIVGVIEAADIHRTLLIKSA